MRTLQSLEAALLIGSALGTMELRAQARDTSRFDTVTVTAKRPSIAPRIREFEERRNNWIGGAFITRAEIEKRHPTRVTDLFLRITSVALVDVSGVKLLASTRGPKFSLASHHASGKLNSAGNQKCILRTGVDGMIMEYGYDPNMLVPEDIDGIEIFPGSATIPSKYTGMSMDKGCGLVLIWTRTGERE